MTDTQTPEAEAATFHCSFCNKDQKDVKKLIAGPGEVFICDECVALCAEIITEGPDESKPSEEQLAGAWKAMLKARATAARAADADLEKVVRQARAKGLDWESIAASLGSSAREVETRFGQKPAP
jgi:ATP-dependent Clp protease ATP-binding subunit ClpX